MMIPPLQAIPIIPFDLLTILLFMSLNLLNLQIGKQIQFSFIFLKLIPILFAILAGIFLFQSANIGAAHQIWSGIPSALPFLIYASMGFEAACLLSNKIKNPKKNAPRAILISYGITLTIAAIYQLCFYGSLGTLLTQFASHKTSYLYAFPTLLAKLLPNSPVIATKLKGVLHLALASSALGGGYGIMFSNTWNLHTLAQNNHLFFKKIFTWFNKHSIPVACVVFEGVIYGIYLMVSGGAQVALQQLSSLGVVLAYTISVLALLIAKVKRPAIRISLWIPVLGMINCCVLIIACLAGLIETGASSFITFSILLLLGALMFFLTAKKRKIA